MSKVVLALALVVLLLSAAACRSSKIPEDADSRLFVPAGVVIYKGNLNGANLIHQVTLTFTAGNDTIRITYRADIETAPGTTRNEILSIIDSTGKIRYNQMGGNPYTGDVTLTVQGLPPGITSEPDEPGFVFHISNDASPGKYTFKIIVIISGKTYPLPCTITVQ